MADPVTEFEQYRQEILTILAGHDRMHLDQFRCGLKSSDRRR
jgi:hypothetical protein